jgi:hypothetical protein
MKLCCDRRHHKEPVRLIGVRFHKIKLFHLLICSKQRLDLVSYHSVHSISANVGGIE